jgi:lipopolysaccharide transport system ATP-binding protein
MSDSVISTKNLTKIYKLYDRHTDRLKEALHPFKKKYHRQFYALKNINLEIKRGEILGIVGRNGAGKSTLLKIITGITSPSSGQISVNGKVSSLLELGTGFNPELTGLENVYLNGTIQGYSRKEMESRIEKIISFADIGHFIRQPLKTYSSGMKARLGFAVAINIDPDILILDEVLSVGDELFKRKCYAKMEELFNSGCTVLFVSHSLPAVNEICTRAILLDKGESILKGPAKLVTMHYQKYLFVRPENAASVRKEIIDLDKDEEKKKKFAVNMENELEAGLEEKGAPNILTKTPTSSQEAFFIPDFKPKSTVITKNYDVDIYDIHIRTPDRKIVNALVTDDEYILSYKMKFGYDAVNVFSNIIFKTEKGFRLGSDVAPGRDKFLEGVRKGIVFLFEWHFQCTLLDGNYFLNVAARSCINGEYIFLNRIEDALAFKVQKNTDKTYKGIVHFNQHAQISLLS